MSKFIIAVMMILSCVVHAQESTNKFTIVKTEKGQARARMPHELRRQGAIRGLVTIPFGKTASGERTHIYRIMGQGGVVADFLDYGARLYRLYVPDATGALQDVVADAKATVVDYEKANDLGPVWRMRPIRTPGSTGLVFEYSTNAVATVDQQQKPGDALARVVYTLDARNKLSVESMVADTNVVKFASDIRLAPFVNRPFTVKTPGAVRSFSTTTNVTVIATRPLTNVTQRVEFNFTGIKIR